MNQRAIIGLLLTTAWSAVALWAGYVLVTEPPPLPAQRAALVLVLLGMGALSAIVARGTYRLR